MQDTTTITEILRLSFNSSKSSLTIESDWLVLAIIVAVLLLAYFIKRNFSKWFDWHEMEVEISGFPKINSRSSEMTKFFTLLTEFTSSLLHGRRLFQLMKTMM